jgi:hypothetical protein
MPCKGHENVGQKNRVHRPPWGFLSNQEILNPNTLASDVCDIPEARTGYGRDH